MARIFLSHSSQNNAAAIALRDWVIKGGWDDHPFLDLDPERGIAAGERWERALHEEADRCEAVLFLVSREWLRSDWCLKEFHLALKLNKRLFGVLIDDLPHSALPTALTTTWQIVNLASGADHELFRAVLPDLSKEEHVTFSRSGLARLKAGLDKAGLDPRFFIWPPEKDPDRSPYPGLRPLEAEDAGIFFGRDASMVVVLDRLRGLREAAPPRLLVILGASGAGKSSFLRAGLAPRLARDDANFLPLPIIRPDTAVITGATGLIHSIQEAFNARGHSFNRAEITNAINGGISQLLPLLNRLAENARALETSGRTQLAPPSLVISIDQGEELFLAEGAKEAQDFLTLLKDLTLVSAPNLIALFTIRSDSYARLQMAKALEGVRQETFALPPMPRGAYQTIIEGPALRLQDSKRPLKIEPALIQALLTDIETGGGKDALPLLAFTLERLYREYGADGDLLAKEYDALGRIRGSIQAAVDAALKAANADPTIPKDLSERLALLRSAFIPALAGVDRETRAARRRVARISEIPEKTRGLINCLVDARLLATDSPPGTGETIIEPAHEALLRQWDALQGWLKEDSVALLMLEGIWQAARDWADNDKSSDWLGHSAGRLEDAERLREREDFARFIGPVEQAYLQACRTQENERRNRELEEARKLAEAQTKIAQRTRIGLIAASVFLVATISAAVFGFRQADKAERQTIIAEDRRINAEQKTRIAMAQRLAAQSQAGLLQNFPQRSLLLAAEAIQVTLRRGEPRVLLAEQALRQALAYSGGHGLSGHEDKVLDVAISPDGRHLVTASADHTARVWDLRNLVTPPTVLYGHEGPVHTLTITPNSRRLVTLSEDHTARVWDLSDLAALPIILGEQERPFTALAISPDGRWLTAEGGETVWRWDLHHTDIPPAALPKPRAPINFSTMAISPDGRWLAAGGLTMVPGPDFRTVVGGGHTALWEMRDTPRLAAELRGHKSEIRAVAFSPDSRRLVTASEDGSAAVWDLQSRDRQPDVFNHESSISAVAISPDGRWLATVGRALQARVWDLDHPKAHSIALAGHEGVINAVKFSPDSRWLATGSNDSTARAWTWNRNGPAASPTVLVAHEQPISALSISGDSRRLVTASRDGSVRVWNLNDLTEPTDVLQRHKGPIRSVAISPEGRKLLSVGEDNAAWVWDLNDTKEAPTPLRGHSVPVPQHESPSIQAVAVSPGSRWLFMASEDKIARVWDLGNLDRQPAVLRGPEGVTHAKTDTPDSRLPASVANGPFFLRTLDENNRVWDHGNPVEGPNDFFKNYVRFLKSQVRHINSIAISPDGQWLVTTSPNGPPQVWDLINAAARHRVLPEPDHETTAVAISPDGRWLITVGDQRTVRVWGLSDFTKARSVLRGHQNLITAVTISFDSHWLVTAGQGGEARLWDLEDQSNESVVLPNPGAEVLTLAITPDNHWVIAGCGDGTVRLWALRLTELEGLASQTAGRNLTLQEWQQYFPGQTYRPIFINKAVPKFDENFAVIARNLTRSEWQDSYPGQPYRKTFPNLPVPADENKRGTQ